VDTDDAGDTMVRVAHATKAQGERFPQARVVLATQDQEAPAIPVRAETVVAAGLIARE